MTDEGLYTLSPTTKEVIAKAKEDERSITVQAFISPEVPQNMFTLASDWLDYCSSTIALAEIQLMFVSWM